MTRTIRVTLSVILLGLLNLPARAQYSPPPPAPLGFGASPQSPVSLTAQPPLPPTYMPPAPLTNTAPLYSAGAYQAPGTNPPLALHDPIGSQWNWSMGIGMYYMEPIFQSNPAFINGHTAANGNAVFAQTDFSQRLSISPLAWLAYSCDNGWGIRGRWFEFSGTGNASATVGDRGIYLPGGTSMASTNPGDPVGANNLLYCDVIDLEAIYTVLGDHWSLTTSAGIRYVHLNQAYNLSAYDPVDGTSNVRSVNNFDGVGPTVSIEGHHAIGGSAFGLYGSARGSIVFGEARQWATFADPVNGTVEFGGHQTSVLCIGEFELGAEWSRRWGRLHLYAQLGCVGQFWSGAGNASQALWVNTTSIIPGSNLGFIGGVVRSGINF